MDLELYYIFNPTLQRRFNRLKYFMKSEEQMQEKMNKIQKQLDTLEWTKNNKRQRIELYQELGRLTEYWKMDRKTIKYYQVQLLEEANLTG